MPPARPTLIDMLTLLRQEADHGVAWRLLAAFATVIAGSVLAAMAPLALKEMVDAVAPSPAATDGPRLPTVLSAGALYLLALCGARLLSEIRPLLAGQAEQRLCNRLSRRALSHLLALPLAFHLAQRSGALVQTLHQATAGVQLLLFSLTQQIAPVLVEAAVVIAVLVHLGQPALVGSFAVTAVAYFAVFVHGAPRLRDRAHAVSQADLDRHALLADSLLHGETLKAFGAEPAACTRLARAADTLEAQWSRLYRQRLRMGIGAAAVFTASIAVSLVIAGQAVDRGTLSVGGFVLANLYMLQIVRPMEALGAGARDLWQALAWIRHLVDVLGQPTEPGLLLPRPDATPPCARDAAAPAVSLRNLHFAHVPGEPAVLDGIDLDIPPGRTVALVGASGAGKSSLVRLLLRLCEPQTGEILIDGRPLATMHPAAVRAMTGLVPQDCMLFHDSIAANIAVGDPAATRAEIEHAARLAHLHPFVETLPAGYDTVVGERGLKLSGGERQRIAIARAVLKRPRLLLLDEATSMLDSATEAAILSNLKHTLAGCTVLVIAHRLSSIACADDIAVLANGRITERGTHAQLLAMGGTYSHLWQLQHPGGSGIRPL